jgi:hypothetical protein
MAAKAPTASRYPPRCAVGFDSEPPVPLPQKRRLRGTTRSVCFVGRTKASVSSPGWFDGPLSMPKIDDGDPRQSRRFSHGRRLCCVAGTAAGRDGPNSPAAYDLNWPITAPRGRDVECIRIPVTRPSGNRACHACRLGCCLRESYDRSVAVPVVTIARAPTPPPTAKHCLISQKVIVEATMKMGNA